MAIYSNLCTLVHGPFSLAKCKKKYLQHCTAKNRWNLLSMVLRNCSLSPPTLNKGHGKNEGIAPARPLFIVSKNVRKLGLNKIDVFWFEQNWVYIFYLAWVLTVVFYSRIAEHTLCLEQLHSFYSSPVHLYTDKPAGDLLWTNPRVVWEHHYSDQWEPSQTDPRRPITGLEKFQEIDREGERIEMKKAPLLRRAALKIIIGFDSILPNRVLNANLTWRFISKFKTS